MTPKMAKNSKRSSVDNQINENLKRVYDDVLNEAVPDRFHDLLAQLKSAGPNAPSSRKDADEK